MITAKKLTCLNNHKKASPSYNQRRRRSLLLTGTSKSTTTFAISTPNPNGTTTAVHQSVRAKARKAALYGGYGFATRSLEHETVAASQVFTRVKLGELIVDKRSYDTILKGPAADVAFARRFPERLRRPEPEEMNMNALRAAGYEQKLSEEGLEAVLAEIKMEGERLFRAVASTNLLPLPADARAVPKEMFVTVPASVAPEHRPTHMLAVHLQQPIVVQPKPRSLEEAVAQRKNPPPPPPHRSVTVYPIHAQILAARCARIPALPVHKTEISPENGEVNVHFAAEGEERVRIRVPVIPFSIPSPQHFGFMVQLLYTQSISAFLSLLIPFEPARSYAGLHSDYDSISLAYSIAGYLRADEIIEKMRIIYGIYVNCACLGMIQDAVWTAIEVAWKGYRDALILKRQ